MNWMIWEFNYKIVKIYTVSFTEECRTLNKQYQQRNKFDLVFIIEIESSFLWCKTLAHGWSRKASTAQNNIWLVFGFVFRCTGNCILNHGRCWWFAKSLCALNIWFHFPNAFNQFKISPVALLIFIQREFFHVIIVKSFSYSIVQCVWVKYRLSDIRSYKIQQVLSCFHKAFLKSKWLNKNENHNRHSHVIYCNPLI